MTHKAEYEPIMTAMTPVFPVFAYFQRAFILPIEPAVAWVMQVPLFKKEL